MTDVDSDTPHYYEVSVIIDADSVRVMGHRFTELQAMGIDVNEWWKSGFRGTIEIKGEL